MKLILCLSALLLLFTASAFSELTAGDLEKIHEMVRGSEGRLKADIVASEGRLTEKIAESKQELKEHISQEFAKIHVKIEEMDRRLTGEIKTLGERLDHIFLLVLALVAFVGVVVGVPQIIVARQRKDMRAQDEKIEA